MSEETKRVLNGEYCNPQLDNYMEHVLRRCIFTLDMKPYMELMKLREAIINGVDYNKNEQVENDNENVLGV